MNREQIVILNRACEIYHATLIKNKNALNFFSDIGLTNYEVINTFNIGFSDGTLKDLITPDSDEHKTLQELNIISKKTEFFYHQYTLPIIDEHGNTIDIYGFDFDGNGKYLIGGNVFNSRALKIYDEIYYTTSIIDTLLLLSIGIKNCTFSDINDTTKAIYRLEFDVKDFILKCRKQGMSNDEIKGQIKSKCIVIEANIEKPSLVSNENDILIFKCKEKTYTVKGFKTNTIIDLKVFIKLAYHNDIIFSNVNLVNEGDRNKFSKMAKERLILSDVGNDLENIALQLEEIQETEYIKSKQDTYESIFASPYIITDKNTALDNLTNRDYLTETLPSDTEIIGLVGEDRNKKLYSIAGISRLDSNPINIFTVSRSGTGKSFCQRKILEMFPDEFVARITRVTSQVLFYLQKDGLKHKIISIDETEGMQQSLYSFRSLMSEGKLSLLFTSKDDKGETRAIRKDVSGPACIFLSSTSLESVDVETRSRMIILHGDESIEQTRAILKAQLKIDNSPEGKTMKNEGKEIIQKHRDMMYMIRPINVYIPESLHSKMVIRENHLSSRRSFPVYTSIIRNIARTRQYSRKIFNDGEHDFIYAEEDDINLANNLIDGILGNLQDLNGTTRTFYEDLIAFIKSSYDGEAVTEYEFNTRQIRQSLKYGETQTRHYLGKLHSLEYLRKIRGKNGSMNFYSLVDDAPIK